MNRLLNEIESRQTPTRNGMDQRISRSRIGVARTRDGFVLLVSDVADGGGYS